MLFSAARFYARKELALTLVSAFVLASLVTRLYSSSDIKALVNKFRVGGGVGRAASEQKWGGLLFSSSAKVVGHSFSAVLKGGSADFEPQNARKCTFQKRNFENLNRRLSNIL